MSNIVCPKCKLDIEWIDPLFCPYCKLELQNYCTNQNCVYFEYENNDDLEKLHSDFKYCPECGTKTSYFNFLTDDTDFPQ